MSGHHSVWAAQLLGMSSPRSRAWPMGDQPRQKERQCFTVSTLSPCCPTARRTKLPPRHPTNTRILPGGLSQPSPWDTEAADPHASHHFSLQVLGCMRSGTLHRSQRPVSLARAVSPWPKGSFTESELSPHAYGHTEEKHLEGSTCKLPPAASSWLSGQAFLSFLSLLPDARAVKQLSS